MMCYYVLGHRHYTFNILHYSSILAEDCVSSNDRDENRSTAYLKGNVTAITYNYSQ